MKLKVYQQGGGLIYTPFIPGRTESTITGSSKDSNGDDPKIDPLDKEILALMKDKDLLPSDIEAISSALIGFQKRTQHIGNPALGGSSDYRSVMPGMLQIMQMVSTARFNRQQWDNSVAEMRKHDAGSEVAMDSYGKIFVLGEDGKLSKVSPNEYDQTKHHAISNSELLQYRERVAGMDGNLLNAMDDLVGKQDVYKAINEIIKAYGTQDKIAFLTKNKAAQAVILDLNSPDGIYNIKKTHTAADLQTAFKVLYDELPTNMQHLLKANAALAGEKSPEIGAYKFINSIISNNISRNLSASFDASATKASGLGGSGSGEGKEQLMKDTYPERLTTGEDIVPYWTNIMTNQSGHTIWAYTQDMGPIMRSGNPIGTVNFDRVLTEFDAAGIIDWSHVTFGDQKLDTIDFPKVVYDGGSTIKRVWMPVKRDGTVDFKAQEELSKLQNWINDNGVINDALIEERVQEIEGAEWDKERKVVRFKDAKPFLVVRGIVSSDKVRFNTDSPYVWKMEKTEGDPRKDWLTMYNNAIATGTSTEGKKRYDYGTAAGRHLYEGNIFLPINSPTIGALVYNDQQVPKSRYMDIRQTAEQNQKAQGFIGNYGE